MKTKLIAVLILISGLAVAVTVVTSTQDLSSTEKLAQGVAETESDKTKRQTIRKRAREAKIHGKDVLTVPKSSGDYIQVDDVEQASTHCTAVIAEPVQVEGILSSDEDRISSCYKFRIVEILSEPAPNPYPFTANPPDKLLPLRENEFVTSLPGGTVMIDGVKVESFSPEAPPLQMSEKYLLFLTFDTTRKVGSLEFGPDSIFLIKKNGALESLNKRARPLHLDVETRFGNSIDRVKSGIKNKAAKR